MKKLLICLLAAAAMLPGSSVFAGTYDAANNKVSVDDTHKMVMIVRNTGAEMTVDDIVYIGQDDNGFSTTEFMLKENPDVGFYTVVRGGDENENPTKNVFFIGKINDFKDKIELNVLRDNVSEDDTTVTKAYVSDDTVELANLKSIVVKYGERYKCQELGITTSGGGSAYIAVKLIGIPKDVQDGIGVWLSSTEISTKDLIIN